MIKAGIIGGAGYTAGELIRLLLNHPDVEIAFINSSSNAGDVHEGLYGETDLVFTDELPLDTIDVLFFCTAHGDTKKFMESHNVPEDLKIIDLSMDYRIKSDDHDFVYGLPELNRRTICQSKHVANPGCFATCIQLGLLPLAKHLLLNNDVMVNAITGSTGAGVKPGLTPACARNQTITETAAEQFPFRNRFHSLPRRLCPWYFCHYRSKDQGRAGRDCENVRRVLCRRFFHPHRRQEYRPEAGS